MAKARGEKTLGWRILAGIVMLFLPGAALYTFLVVAAIMLIVISIVTLFTLPKKVADPLV